LAHIRLTDARTFITLTSLKMGGQFAPREGELYPLADRKSRCEEGVRKFLFHPPNPHHPNTKQKNIPTTNTQPTLDTQGLHPIPQHQLDFAVIDGV